MKAGIANKLTVTYITIIIATIISGTFCLYVLNLNQRTNAEMRYVTLPSIEHLKEMKSLVQEIKKLANKWVYVTNSKDKERLEYILAQEYPGLNKNLNTDVLHWTDEVEQKLCFQIIENNKQIIDSVVLITSLLNSPESFTNDQAVDSAAEIYNSVASLTIANDKLYEILINTKSGNLETQQRAIAALLNYLCLIVLLTIAIVIIVSLFSLRFSRNNVVSPLLKLNEIILDMAVGKVISVGEIERQDEIGQMHNAISKLINGIVEKINFSEQIGKGNYETDFSLLSGEDKLGVALLTMRNDLKKSNETLLEQDKRLVNAQKLARVGNYFFDLKTNKFQSSVTLDDILGIDDSFEKNFNNWLSLISPDFRQQVADGWKTSIKEKSRFEDNFIIRRYNDQQERWVNVICEYNHDEKGETLTMFGTLQDITERKALEIELNNSSQVTTEQNRRLLNFSYIVSHNLRMHAVNIHSLLDLIAESKSEEDKQKFMQLLHKASNLLDETMHHLNEVVAMQNPVNVEIELQVMNNHIHHALDVLKTQITNKNAIIQNNINDDFCVMYNPAYLDSILLNFISNALKYSHPDRRPIVTIDCYKENAAMENSKWILQIADNGLGIDLEKHGHKIFGMYKTFHNNKDAKGIGLFMTKYQVEAMGGKIEVESELHKGTTFKIYIK